MAKLRKVVFAPNKLDLLSLNPETDLREFTFVGVWQAIVEKAESITAIPLGVCTRMQYYLIYKQITQKIS